MIVSARTLILAENTLPAVRHLPLNTDDRVRRVIARAVLDLVAVVENPIGSNRGEQIDEYNQRAGVALASYWCASAFGAWYDDAGIETPRGYASCDNWMAWAKKTRRWSTTPVLGGGVLYGKPGDASHIGLVARVSPLVLSIEANTTIESGFSRNGIAVAIKIVDPTSDPVLGYFSPFPLDDATSGPIAA